MPESLLLTSELAWPLALAIAWVAGEFGHRWTGLPRISIYGLVDFVLAQAGLPPDNPAKYAPYAAAINLLAGAVVVTVIVGVVTASFDYATWSAMAGVTIWLKIIADFILSRHAHPFRSGKKDD